MFDSVLSTTVLALSGFLVAYVISSAQANRRTSVDVPLVGRSGLLGIIDFLKNGRQILQKGYDQYKSRVFKVRTMGKYVVYVSGRPLVEELRKAPEDVLSFNAAVAEALQTEHTLGSTIVSNHYHVSIIRSQLTRNLGVLFPDIVDEAKAAFGDNVDAKFQENEWVKLPAYDTVMNVVARISNRVFLGLPVCRDPGFIKLSIKITLDVVKSGQLLRPLPRFLRPLAARWFSAVPGNLKESTEYVGPIIADRRRKLAEYGEDWSNKPNDMLMWLMDEATTDEQTMEKLVTRIMTLNFAAVHTSSMSFTHVLFHLAANPEYAAPMREEIQRVADQEGWSKAAFGNMHKLDSFVRESLRVNGIGSVSMNRLALKPYTFADGTHIPVGAYVAVPSAAMHGDEDNYDDAHTFKPFRFASESAEVPGDGNVEDEGKTGKIRPYAVSTSPNFVTFGHGQHACPGRFFAVNELKIMLAHILMNYDVKLEDGVRPPNICFGEVVIPNTKAQVMFRKRQT